MILTSIVLPMNDVALQKVEKKIMDARESQGQQLIAASLQRMKLRPTFGSNARGFGENKLLPLFRNKCPVPLIFYMRNRTLISEQRE